MLVVVDIGNTAVKFGVFVGERLAAVERVEGGAGLESLHPIGAVASADEVVVVASTAAATREALVERLGRTVRLLGDDVRSAVPTTYARPSELGLDRVAAAWGARVLRGGVPVVVAGVGTAITVDGLDAAGRLVAVAIAPGLAAAAGGLARAAPHLPQAPTSPGVARVPARGTADSLRTGFLVGFAGLVDRLLDEAKRAVAGGDLAAVLTGGGAPSIAPHLRTPHVHEPHAVLHGIRALHLAVPA